MEIFLNWANNFNDILTVIISFAAVAGLIIGLFRKLSKVVAKDIKHYVNEVKYDIADEIKKQNVPLEKGVKSLLRKSIIDIYKENKKKKRITDTEKELLDDYFLSYKRLNGNGYIEKIYNRMCKWEIVYDDDEEE